MSKLFVKILFVVMTAVMVITACSTASETPTAYSNPPTATQPPAYADPSSATNAPAATEPPAASGPISFASDILPIFQSRCINCHGGDRTEKGLDLKSYASLMNGSERGPVLVAGDAANSSLVNLISSGKMPKRGPKLTPEQVQLIIDWINQGALNN
jgi:mono/diheme cytochrome c family protein